MAHITRFLILKKLLFAFSKLAILDSVGVLHMLQVEQDATLGSLLKY